jgi:hypothetical protein
MAASATKPFTGFIGDYYKRLNLPLGKLVNLPASSYCFLGTFQSVRLSVTGCAAEGLGAVARPDMP